MLSKTIAKNKIICDNYHVGCGNYEFRRPKTKKLNKFRKKPVSCLLMLSHIWGVFSSIFLIEPSVKISEG